MCAIIGLHAKPPKYQSHQPATPREDQQRYMLMKFAVLRDPNRLRTSSRFPEDHVRQVLRYLAEKRDAKQRITFYELEDHFGVHGARRSESEAFTRGKLCAIVRYFTFHDAYFEAFLA